MITFRELPRRTTRFVTWLFRTPWPVYALAMLQANVVGAVFVFGFLRFALPVNTTMENARLQIANQLLFFAFLAGAVFVGGIACLKLSLPVLVWLRRGSRQSGPEAEFAKHRALRMPVLQTYLHIAIWTIGGIVFVAVNWEDSRKFSLIIAVATVLGATTTCILGYLQAERILRPVAVAAMRDGMPENTTAPGVTFRLLLAWTLGSGVPTLAIILVVAAQEYGLIDTDSAGIAASVLILSVSALLVGLLGIILIAGAISDPLRQLRQALGEVQRGNFNTQVKIYDASEIGLMQAGFNDMVHDLSERQQLRDLFGRYVGEDVARRALEYGTELGGRERQVAVLFVDLVGSTRLAVTLPPAEVVELLNEFFRVVVDVVGRHGGYVNKFQGDAALAIFGAPIEHPDSSAGALAAARDMCEELTSVVDLHEFGIGVSAGRAIAGHIGALARFEYTVIGDPVNEAARLTELAKSEPGRILASAAAVQTSGDAEALQWEVGEIVELRGRGALTQLARPR
ncbi:MAG: adenylate/guanylate cyclase domain-containing protein [Mycobacteriaceae bacterium]